MNLAGNDDHDKFARRSDIISVFTVGKWNMDRTVY